MCFRYRNGSLLQQRDVESSQCDGKVSVLDDRWRGCRERHVKTRGENIASKYGGCVLHAEKTQVDGDREYNLGKSSWPDASFKEDVRRIQAFCELRRDVVGICS